MAESPGERKRKETLERAESARDALLNFSWMLPRLIREVDEIVAALGGRPAPSKPEEQAEPEAPEEKPAPKRKGSKAKKADSSG
ncbi:MAG: hypothetical protein ACRDPE_15240 [Solirubrobacterales bacterium]